MPFSSTIGKRCLTRLILLFAVLVLSVTASGLNYIEVYANPGPDLVIQEIILSPEEPALDDTLTITIAVKNQGTTEAGNSYVACHIDDTILTSGYIGAISAGTTRTTTFTWTVQADSHTIKAIADSSDLIAEDDENNNTQTYNFTALAADLIVESISWTPENPSKGDDIIFSVVVRNQGNNISFPTTVHLYADDVSRGCYDIAILNPGEAVTKTFNWMAPAGQQPIKAVVDEADTVNEGNESNNEKYLTFSTLSPDLIIEAITWLPENPSRNDVVTFTTTVKNQGNGRSDSCHLGYYIDKEYYSVVKIGSLEAGTSANSTFNWTIISDVFEFKPVIDLYSDVVESEENNNEKKVNVLSMAPDLTIKDISWTPEDAAVGDTLTFTVTVRNQGSGNAGASHLSYYIGNVHSGYVDVPVLATGNETTVAFQWEAQLDILALSVRVVADYDDIIIETIEYNNVHSRNISLLLPDLVIAEITWSPENPTVGETVTFTVNVDNQGNGKTGIFHIAYYIDDVLLDTDPIYTAELSTSVNKTCTWKSQMGLHIFKAVVDCNKLITESNENNNTASVTVIPNMPDLYVNNVTWSPVNFKVGEEVTFSVSVKNRGGIDAAPCRLVCYTDSAMTGYQDIGQIDPGAAIMKDFVWIATDGTHNIELVIDTNDSVNEFDETNNSRIVLLPPPDLIIQDISWTPADAGIGDNVTLSATIMNQGIGKAHDSQLTFYVDNIVVDILNLPEMTTGQTVSRSCEWTVEAVTHDIRIFVDDGNLVTESDETNNEEIFVLSPQSADLVLETVNWSMENALTDNEVTFTVVVENQGNYKSETSQLDYYVDDVLLESEEVVLLGPGETTTFTLIITVEAGLHTFKIIADSGDQIVESDETNNERELAFSTMAPDLLVKNITLTPVIADIGDTITITVKLENRGRDAALNTSLDLRINGSSLGVTDIEEIDVGQIIIRDYTWTVEEGSYEFSAYVDLEELILENNEDNNILSKTVTFSQPENTDSPVVEIPSTSSTNTGIMANSWLIIMAAAALLGCIAFFVAFKASRKE